MLFNKDKNIHKSEALKRYDKRRKKIVSSVRMEYTKYKYLSFDVELLQNSLNTEYCLRTYGQSVTENQINRIIISYEKLLLKSLKWTYGHSSNDCRVATLSKSYLTTTRIIMQS